MLKNLLSCHTGVTYCHLTMKDGFVDMKVLGPQAMWPAHRRDCDPPVAYRAASTAAALARCVCKRVVRVCQERVRCSSWGLPLQVYECEVEYGSQDFHVVNIACANG